MELGQDLSRSPTSAHFDSCLGLCPKNQISGGNVPSSKTGPDVNRAAQAPRRATETPQKRKSGPGQEFRRLSARAGIPTGGVTVHRLPRIVYPPINDRVEYQDGNLTESGRSDPRCLEPRVRQPARRLVYKPVPQGDSSSLSSWAASSRPFLRSPVRSFPHAPSGVRRSETGAPIPENDDSPGNPMR